MENKVMAIENLEKKNIFSESLASLVKLQEDFNLNQKPILQYGSINNIRQIDFIVNIPLNSKQ